MKRTIKNIFNNISENLSFTNFSKKKIAILCAIMFTGTLAFQMGYDVLKDTKLFSGVSINQTQGLESSIHSRGDGLISTPPHA